MAVNPHSCECGDEEYIDLEVSSHSHFFCHSIHSPPHPREFEFQMSSVSLERDTTTSPADELFYKGKLLPLHLPPRLQMVEKLLQNSNSTCDCKTGNSFEQDFYSTPLAATPTAASTPFESCNISPADSLQVSRELDPEEYFFQCSNPRKSWTRKLKLIKQSSSLSLKLKASKTYIKSFFTKSGCSHKPNIGEGSLQKAKKTAFGLIHRSATGTITFDKERSKEDNGGGGQHRRSFSVVMKRHSVTNCPSSSSSSGSSSSSFSRLGNSKGACGPRFLKRSSSADSEFESSIQGAIAHCKQSQQLFRSRNAASEAGFCSFSASRIAVCEDQQRTS